MNMSVNRAVAIAAAIDQTELRSLYGQAVSHGAANTLCTPPARLTIPTNASRGTGQYLQIRPDDNLHMV